MEDWNNSLDYAALSDVGPRRANNQDSHAAVLAEDKADFERRGHFFMVADGMGAHAAGEVASRMAVDAVAARYREQKEQTPHEALLAAVVEANEYIYTRGQASIELRGMGTTATAFVVLPGEALVAHVGDSRAYRLRGPRIEQLTFDHSLVWEIRASRQLAKLDVPGYISKNIITRSLGPNAKVQVDLGGPFPLEPGDTFLLCSDGLSGQVEDDEIGMILDCLPPSEAAQMLIDLANLRGGPDNITAVVFRVRGQQTLPPPMQLAPLRAAPAIAPTAAPSAAKEPISPHAWGGIAVIFFFAALLLFFGHPWFALPIAFAGIMALLGILGKPYLEEEAAKQDGTASASADGKRQFGRGPYVACDCTPNAERRARLADILEKVRVLAVKENYPLDWTHADQSIAQATAAAQANHFSESARNYLRALLQITSQLRQIRNAAG